MTEKEIDLALVRAHDEYTRAFQVVEEMRRNTQRAQTMLNTAKEVLYTLQRLRMIREGE